MMDRADSVIEQLNSKIVLAETEPMHRKCCSRFDSLRYCHRLCCAQFHEVIDLRATKNRVTTVYQLRSNRLEFWFLGLPIDRRC